MEKYGLKNTQARGLKLTTATLSAGEVYAEAFRGLKAKFLAMRLRASSRTTEKWLHGNNVPTGAHVIEMLRDDELCARLLAAAGREDLARSAETIAHLKAALRSEGK